MPVATSDRARAVDAVDVLNDFIGDFITGVMVLREYRKQHYEGKLQVELMIPIQKMCLSHLVLSFAKFEEFWQHYHDLVPQEHRDPCKNIRKSMRVRKISEFRNRCVGHIWDNGKQRPLAHSEVMSALAAIMEPDLVAFLDWINSPSANTYPLTVVSVVEAIRNALLAIYDIQPHEFIDR
jgi:hypothetical protein